MVLVVVVIVVVVSVVVVVVSIVVVVVLCCSGRRCLVSLPPPPRCFPGDRVQAAAGGGRVPSEGDGQAPCLPREADRALQVLALMPYGSQMVFILVLTMPFVVLSYIYS